MCAEHKTDFCAGAFGDFVFDGRDFGERLDGRMRAELGWRDTTTPAAPDCGYGIADSGNGAAWKFNHVYGDGYEYRQYGGDVERERRGRRKHCCRHDYRVGRLYRASRFAVTG